jgi:uncharacterized OB-fold protein
MADDSREFTAASFYQFLKEGKLMGIHCRACGTLSAEARPLCPTCHNKDVEWRQFTGRARLSTFTCISVVPDAMARKGYGRNNPYCSGIVTLEEGPRISAQILGVDASNPQNIRTGLALILKLDELDPESPALSFQPA